MAQHQGVTHLKPSLRFPKGGWLVRYRDAESKTLRKTFATLKQAQDFREDVRSAIRQGTYRDSSRAYIPFGKVADRWWEAKGRHKSVKTAAGYNLIIESHLKPHFGKKAIGKIKPSDIDTFLGELSDRGIQPATQRNIFRVLSQVLKHAVRDDIIAANPCEKVTLPKSDRRPMLFLNAEQVRALADAINPQYRTLVLFAADSGLRVGEIAALQVKHIDVLHGRVTVERSVADVGGELHFKVTKSGRVRVVDVPPFIMDLLEKQMDGKSPEDLVFTGAYGKPLRHGNYYQRHFKPATEKIGVPKLRFHDLRHTAVALMIDQGFHPKVIADRMGHASISITMDRYGHLFPTHSEDIKKKMQAVWDGSADNGNVRRLHS